MTLPTSFQERVSARITETIADLIPQDDIDRLVQARIATFMEKDLPDMIREELRKQYGEMVKSEVQVLLSQYRIDWDGVGQRHEPRDALAEIIKGVAPDIIASVLGNFICMSINNIRSSLPRY